MKTARIVLGLIMIAGILAFLLTWMRREERYAPDPVDITARSSSLDKVAMMMAVNEDVTIR